MIAQNFLRIYNKNKTDFIDLHNRNFDGDIIRVKKELKNQKIYWKNFIAQIQADLINTEYDFEELMAWSERFEQFLKVDDYFPSFENLSALFIMKAFNQHHILPNYNHDSKQLLEFWGYKEPNLNLVFDGVKSNFTAKFYDIVLEPKKVDLKEFKIVRIQTHDENGKTIFTDIKIRNFDRKQFLFDILTLPEFWRNFHFVSRKKKIDGAIKDPAYELNKSLNLFYTPNKNFSIISQIGKNKKEIFENVKSESPFNLYVNSLAMHIFFTQPGLALPLTAKEQLWSNNNEPAMTITINQNEVNLLTINYSSNSIENKSTLEEFSEQFSEREQMFAKFFDLGQYSGGQYLLTTHEEFAFVYETNMIALFDSLTKLDKHKNI